MRKHHDLKCLKKYYWQVVQGYKPFELRRNDRGFEVGDTITLYEVEYPDFPYFVTGRSFGPLRITSVVEDEQWLQPGFCCLGIRKVTDAD